MDVIEEFSGLSNAEAYAHIFSKRMMKPVPGKVGEFLGCDHRTDMFPLMRGLVSNAPKSVSVFDVGAGAGDTVDWVLKDLPEGSIINLVEPNAAFLASYTDKLNTYPHLRTGIAYEGTLQDYSTGRRGAVAPSAPQQLILCNHMIYHLTDFTQPNITPESDLVDAIAFLYDLLAPGGALCIAYADLLDHDTTEALCGVGAKYFAATNPSNHLAQNLTAIYTARNALLGPDGSITDRLKERFPGAKATLHSEWRMCHLFGDAVEDLAVMALAAELCSADSDLFDVGKLQFSLDYVANNSQRLGIQREERDIPQHGLWRGYEPHVVATITKTID